MTSGKKPPKRVEEGSAKWKQRRKEILETYAPPIKSCKNCGSPRHESYICVYCGKE